jgi:hypothetical protein
VRVCDRTFSYHGLHQFSVETGVGGVAPVILQVNVPADRTWQNLHNVSSMAL